MAEKNRKIEENFFTSNIFIFDSYECESRNETEYINPGGSPEEVIYVRANTLSPIHFAFGSKVGLVRINNDGSIAERNILGKLLAIKKTNFDHYGEFFQKNGFLFPIAYNGEDSITKEALLCIVDRLQATLELMSTISDASRTSYEKIIRLIFFHLFSPVVTIETREGKYKYSSSRHMYRVFLENAKYEDRDSRLYDTFNNEYFEFNDSCGVSQIDASFVDQCLNGTLLESKYASPLFQEVIKAYCAPRNGKSKNMLMINDFIFHYLYEVGIIDHVDLEKTYYVNNEYDKSSFSDVLKERALIVAKHIIKEEIESNLRRVRPTYDTTKLEPTWKIDSLLSALYFGLFYMRPNLETYRRCANRKCGEFFLVTLSSQKKKYCCTACMNREMAARKRIRDKMKENNDNGEE